MVVGQGRVTTETPVFTFSLKGALVLNLGFGIFFLAIAIYALVAEGFLSILPAIVVAASAYSIYKIWHKPLREARFYDDHLHISGWKVNADVSYGDIERLVKAAQRKFLGEVVSSNVVWFRVKGGPNHNFEVGNGKIGPGKIELYQWLLTKNQKAREGQAEPSGNL